MQRRRLLGSEDLQLKYKLNELMMQLTKLQYSKAIAELPKLIGKSKASIHNYRYITVDSKTSIPYEAGILIEKYFNIPAGSLLNEMPESITDLDEEIEHSFATFA